jgi:hypothetical protein
MKLRLSKKQKTLAFVGFIISLLTFLVSEFNFGIISSLTIANVNGQTLSVAIVSNNPDPLAFLSAFNIYTPSTYVWKVQITNTGQVAFAGHFTVRIVNPNGTAVSLTWGQSSYMNQQFEEYLGAQGVPGAVGTIQSCNGQLDSTSCLVNLQQWNFVLLNGTFSFNPGGNVASGSFPVLQPGQSIVLSFKFSPPEGTPPGVYLGILNLVGYVGSTPYVLGSSVTQLQVGNGLTGSISTQAIVQLASLTASIILAFLLLASI